jgi:hypothetical protein
MKALALGCETMREGVVVTFVFFILGMLFILAGANIVPQVFNLPHIMMFIGFLLLLFSPVILISTFLLSVLPRFKKRMEECKH